jgi:hypothetical protein
MLDLGIALGVLGVCVAMAIIGNWLRPPLVVTMVVPPERTSDAEIENICVEWQQHGDGKTLADFLIRRGWTAIRKGEPCLSSRR